MTNAERLVISRRRRGMSVTAEARRIGVSFHKLRAMEAGHEEVKEVPLVRDLTTGEKLYLARRRVGMSQTELALKLGMSRFWVREMEKDHATANELILNYWGIK